MTLFGYFELDKETLRVLRYIYHKKNVAYSELQSAAPKADTTKAFRVLAEAGYIYGDFDVRRFFRTTAQPPENRRIWCTAQGKWYVEHRHVDRFREIRNWLAFGLSIVAIIISVISLILQAQ